MVLGASEGKGGARWVGNYCTYYYVLCMDGETGLRTKARCSKYMCTVQWVYLYSRTPPA